MRSRKQVPDARVQKRQSYRADRDRGGEGRVDFGAVPSWHDSCTHIAKPRMPRLGTEQMRYMRSRPWRPRGPWFDNRTGARRRGRRADELIAAVSDDLLVPDGIAPDGIEGIEAEDVLLPGPAAWPVQLMPTVWAAHDRASLLAPHGPGYDRALQPIDQLLEADVVVAAH